MAGEIWRLHLPSAFLHSMMMPTCQATIFSREPSSPAGNATLNKVLTWPEVNFRGGLPLSIHPNGVKTRLGVQWPPSRPFVTIPPVSFTAEEGWLVAGIER